MRRVASGLLTLVVLTGCGQAASSGATGGASAPPAASATTGAAVTPAPAVDGTPVTVKDFTIQPGDVTVAAGTVTLMVSNQGPTIHNVTIRDSAATVIVATKDLKEGQSETVSANLKAGTYVLFCSLPGHESLGTNATLEVSP